MPKCFGGSRNRKTEKATKSLQNDLPEQKGKMQMPVANCQNCIRHLPVANCQILFLKKILLSFSLIFHWGIKGKLRQL